MVCKVCLPSQRQPGKPSFLVLLPWEVPVKVLLEGLQWGQNLVLQKGNEDSEAWWSCLKSI